MELVYLWVEDYKNIHHQGFNFSPRFTCQYNEATQELSITKNEEHVSIFPPNINVTAIVGENGSGKSSVFEALTFLFWRKFLKDDGDKTFFIYENNGTFHIQCDNYKNLPINKKDLTDFITFQNSTTIKNPEIFSARGQMPLIAFSNCISDITNNRHLQNLKHYSNFYNGIQPKKPMMESEITYHNFNQKFQYILKKNANSFNFIDETFIFDSYQCEIQLQEIEVGIIQYDNKKFSEYISFQKKKHLNNEELLYKMLIVLAIEMTMDRIHTSKHSSLKPNTANAEILKQYIKENIEDKIINKIDNFNDSSLKFTLEICQNSLKRIDEYISEEIFNINLFSAYFQWEPIKPMNNSHELFIDYEVPQSNTIFQSQIFRVEDNYLETIYNNELLNFMMNNNILRCNFLNSKKNNCHFLELSSGEKLFLNVLTNFAYTLFRLQDDFNGVMLFDEIELSFHPNWQKRLLKSFIHIQNEISKTKKLYLHLIFTSHSPFVLSDLPKENVIFLEKGKQVYPKIETFGANIHTLLSHGFFMKDGLMGEFAKGKITAIKDFYEKVKKSKNPKNEHKQEFENNIENFRHIQSIIGEPFLKTIIKNYLDELELVFDTEDYKLYKKQELLKQFSKEELQTYLDSTK
ncbi:AAA family ATPase [Sulfurimonas sp.]|uniref:AAA family ATPase n=1 Tax=Sulfurimonas sp. TaxID=2022749 RepID=UPI002618D6AF|nr:AAA family ATPase [Sulfurimonas sp.]MDD3854677.1 AAA family ATPase [Sulfurimonas sp.]